MTLAIVFMKNACVCVSFFKNLFLGILDSGTLFHLSLKENHTVFYTWFRIYWKYPPVHHAKQECRKCKLLSFNPLEGVT